ncbi:MAG: hypothetical protein Q8R35_00785 [bacterium]|nr:hypothetical protein [bacterium]
MKRFVGIAVLICVAVALAVPAVAQERAPFNEVKFVFDAGSLDHVLELYGVVDPNVGSLVFSYEVREAGVTFRTRGVRPGLDETQPLVLYRLVYLISEGTMRVSVDRADQFRRKYLYGRAVFEDERLYGKVGTAKRFGMPESDVGQWVESYFSVHGGVFKPFPTMPGQQV